MALVKCACIPVGGKRVSSAAPMAPHIHLAIVFSETSAAIVGLEKANIRGVLQSLVQSTYPSKHPTSVLLNFVFVEFPQKGIVTSCESPVKLLVEKLCPETIKFVWHDCTVWF